MNHPLAISPLTLADMTTYYCHTLEEALKRAKAAGKRPGCWYGGIVLRSGKKGLQSIGKGKWLSSIRLLGENRYIEVGKSEFVLSNHLVYETARFLRPFR